MKETQCRYQPLGSYNLALGNSPWVPDGYGSARGHDDAKQLLWGAITERAKSSGESFEKAAYHIAWEEIIENPTTFVVRALLRLQMFWAIDSFPLRHFFHIVYPPLQTELAAILLPLTLLAYLTLLGLILLGALYQKKTNANSSLIVLYVLAAMALPSLTLGMSRLHLPPLILSLPFAAFGLNQMFSGRRPYYLKSAITSIALVWFLTLTTAPRVITPHLNPSHYYANVLSIVDSLLGTTSEYADRIMLRVRDPKKLSTLTIQTTSSATQFRNNSQEITWHTEGTDSVLTLDINTSELVEQIALRISAPALDVETVIQPVQRKGWQKWLSTDIVGLEYQWLGGVP